MTQKRDTAGLNMVYPKDFIWSLKLKLLQKIGDIEFEHKWKEIMLMQVEHPEYPGMCFENGLVSREYSFTYDLIQCYVEWKDKTAKINNKCIDHCIWDNCSITDIGSKLWVPQLIDNNINYLSEFVNSEGKVMSYKEFCTITLDRCWHLISKREYVDLKMAIRRFNNPSIPQKDLNNIDPNLKLRYFTDTLSVNVKASKIRDLSNKKAAITEILSLKNWSRDLELETIDWKLVFKNMYGGFTKNLKLLQFQYKLLMRISTCRYMRYKMKIDINSPNCIYCTSQVETLYHIFLECPKTTSLMIYLEELISNKVMIDYNDPNKLFYITCCHSNQSINYIWAAFKLYISHCFQRFKEPSIRGFTNYVASILHGESSDTINSITSALTLDDEC